MTGTEDTLVVGESKVVRPRVTPAWISDAGGRRYLLAFDHLEYEQTEAYSPMQDEPALNAALAELELTEDSIAEFVRAFGWLGVEERFTTADGETAYGEPFATWAEEVNAFRWLRDIVHGKTEPDYYSDEIVTDDEQRAWRQLSFNAKKLTASIIVPAFSDPAKVYSAARDKVIETALAEPLWELVGAFIANAVISFRPKSLLGAAYLQVAQDYEGKEVSRYGRCQTCGRYFVVSPRNPKQKGCGSNSCRQVRYDTNRETAYRLKYDEGLTIAQITKRMSADLGENVTKEQVQRWIAAAEKRKGKGRDKK